MNKKNYLKLTVLILVVLSLIYLFNNAYRNYQTNEMISDLNTNIIYSDHSSKFKKVTDSDIAHDMNQLLLDSIGQIKDSTINEFLAKTEQKIIFVYRDTLTIRTDGKTNSTYSSSLDKGIFDRNFNELLVKSITPFLIRNDIEQIDIFSLTPTEFNSVPPPPGTLANFDY